MSKFRASYLQERLWFIDKFETGSVYKKGPSYHNVPLILHLKGQLEIELLSRCIDQVIAKHQILRARFVTDDARPFVSIATQTNFSLKQVDLSFIKDSITKESAIERVIDDSKQSFDIESEPLVRSTLFRLNTDEYILSIVLHHALCDRKSIQLITNEIIDLYKTKAQHLPDSHNNPMSYSDFSEWQWSFSDAVIESMMFYWKSKFPEKNEVLELPTDHPRAAIHIYKEGRINFNFSESVRQDLLKFSKREGASPHIPLLALFKIALHRITGQREITVGIITENRVQPGTDLMIGPLSNLLPIKSIFSGTESFYKFYKDVSENSKSAILNQQLPFEKMVLELSPANDMSRTALFDVLFHYDEVTTNIPVSENLLATSIDTNLGWGKYDINLLVNHSEDGLSGTLVYNRELFLESSARQIMKCFIQVVEQLTSKPNRLISEFELVTEDDINKIFNDHNRSDCSYPNKLLIHSNFIDRATEFPEETAVQFKDLNLSYRELNDRSTNLATVLRNQYKIGKGEFVGILLDRSELTIISILGILKAGAAYVPIDPNYPKNRIQYILQDSNCKAVIIHGEDCKVNNLEYPGYFIDLKVLHANLTSLVTCSVDNINEPADTAYVIYTSGTTGNPKGCIVSHENVIRLMINDRHPFTFDHTDIWVVAHSFCFDFSVWEMYGALLYGGRLLIPEMQIVRDPVHFIDFIRRNKVTVLNQTPAAFNALTEVELESEMKTLDQHLRYVIFGGDKLVPSTLKGWVAEYSLDKIRLINMYGITETTVHVTFYQLTRADINGIGTTFSPIGRPLPGVSVYILDHYLRAVPIGITGEIFVGGSGLSKGYWNKPDLTNSRFINNPYRPGQLMYKSGDCGRWTHDGNLQYIGRNDNQAKIRGFRIELGEVEQKLNNHPDVERAIAIVKTDGSQEASLAAYVVLNKQLEVKELREYLKAHLPDHMIPSFIVLLNKFPLTYNGKIDFKALSEIDDSESLVNSTFVAARNPVEEAMVALWSEVLGKHQISVLDNFFEIGGHSLKATRTISAIHKTFGVRLDLKTIFQNPTIADLGVIVSQAKEKLYQEIQPAPVAEYYDLSHSQKRIWLANRLTSVKYEYNVPYNFLLKGDIDQGILLKSLVKLIQRHEILRTKFVLVDDLPVQVIISSDRISFSLTYEDLVDSIDKQKLTGILIERISKEVFDLEKGTLMRAQLVKLEKDKYAFTVVLHHIISDAWSMEILLAELSIIYDSILKKKHDGLADLAIQYKDYSFWQNAIVKGGQLESERQYWLNKLKNLKTTVDLPYDRERRDNLLADGRSVSEKLSNEARNELQTLNSKYGTSYFMLLLAGIQTLLYRYCGSENISVGFPVAGRNHPALENQIGYYSNTLIFTGKFLPEDFLEDVIRDVKADVLESLENQNIPFDQVSEELNKTLKSTGSILFNVGLTWHDEVGIPGASDMTENFSAEVYSAPHNISITDLWFNGYEVDDTLVLSVDYNASLFERSTIETMLQRLIKILETLGRRPRTRISEIQFEDELVKSREEVSIHLRL